LRNQGIK